MDALGSAFETADVSLDELLSRLGDDAQPLAFEYAGRRIQAGYHVTEVKAGSFATLDCGGNPDAWQETILQVEDIADNEGKGMMTVGKFRSILSRVERQLSIDGDARVTIEIGRPDEAMRVFDIADVVATDAETLVRLGERPAICKPRHRAARQATSACCGSTASPCCA